MGKKAVFDILQESGADWINVPGDFTKRVTSDGIQVFLSLSPTGDSLACYFETPQGSCFKIHQLPLSLFIFDYLISTKDQIINKLRASYPWISIDSVFQMKNKYGSTIALAIAPSADRIVVLGLDSEQDTAICLYNK